MTADLHPVLAAALRDAPADRLSDADWDAVVTEAEAQALTPLLRRWLWRGGLLERVAAPARARLERHAVAHVARTLLLARTQASVLSALAAAGVRAAPLRGPALGERLYDDPALRPCGDVDVLVDRAALGPVERALAALGFHEVDRRTGFAREFSYALELVESSHGVVVEPHFTLGYPPFTEAVDLGRVWSRARRARMAGVESLTLGSEATLLNLCLHVVHKAPAVPALWIYDLDRLVRREGAALDWPEFVALARASRLAPLVASTLRQATALFDSPVPDDVLAELERAAASPLARLLSGTSVDGKESLAALLALPGWRARLRYASAVLFPSPRFMTLEYGLTRRRQLGAAYVRRAGYFTWQGLKGMVRLCS
ncbi:MAG TPA: nucleotidyltransferase family protein [Methylomirabilota bacterium]|jgi:hypothetical protein